MPDGKLSISHPNPDLAFKDVVVARCVEAGGFSVGTTGRSNEVDGDYLVIPNGRDMDRHQPLEVCTAVIDPATSN